MASRKSFKATNHGGMGYRSYSSLAAISPANQHKPLEPETLVYIQSNCLNRFRRTSSVFMNRSKSSPHILEARLRNTGMITAFVNTFTLGVTLESGNQTGVLLFNFPDYEKGLVIVPDLDLDFVYKRGKLVYSTKEGLQRIPRDTKEGQGWLIDTFRTYDRLVRERESKSAVNPLLIYKLLNRQGQ